MPEVVVIVFRRIRMNGVRRRIISEVRTIGISAALCNEFFMTGRRVGPAARCLLIIGFQRVLSRDNVLVYIRVR